MKRKIPVRILATVLLATVSLTHAQHPEKIPRIGYLSSIGTADAPASNDEAFRQGLRDLGYAEGKNILVEYRSAEGKRDRIPALVADLVQLKVDVLVLGTPPAVRAAKQATKTIPIVIVTAQDPVAAGYVDSLARPGGNITGLTRLTRDLSGKRLELLKETVPGISRVGLFVVADPAAPRNAQKEYEAAARALKIPLQSLELRSGNPDIDSAFQEAAKGRVSALIIPTNFALEPYAKKIADLAIKSRLPLMAERTELVEAGALVSYTSDDTGNFRRAAYYVDRILKGTKPADLPVEQPMKFEFVVNLKTAKQIGRTIPPEILARANRIIR